MTPRGDTPEVSVVIPTRNRRYRLHRTLKSALAQENVELEVVVVNDGSRDRTAEYLRSHPDPRVFPVTHAAQAGLAAARNSGLAHARAPWIALLDDDDLWSPSKLRKQLDAAYAQNSRWVYSSVIGVDDSLREVFRDAAPEPQSLLEPLLAENALIAGGSNVCVHRDLLARVGNFDERLNQLADWDLWIRLAAAERPASETSVLTAYVLHPENMVLGRAQELEAELDYLAEKHRQLHSRYPGSTLNRAAISEWAAWSHGRVGRRREALRLYLASAVRYRRIDHLVAGLELFLPRRDPSPDSTQPCSQASWLMPAQ